MKRAAPDPRWIRTPVAGNTHSAGCDYLHMPHPVPAPRLVTVWRCPVCRLRVEVQDPRHMPIVAALHELARCWTRTETTR